MPQQLISRSADLKRLRDEGYELEILDNRLLVRHVPYVTAERAVAYGVLISELTLAGDRTVQPGTHVVGFAGAAPCDSTGQRMDSIINGPVNEKLSDGTTVAFNFSSKPPAGYPDYYAKISTYAAILTTEAQAVDPTATATPFTVIETDQDESVFCYMDTATSRAGIDAATRRLETGSVAIVGLGGTGSYILDLIAKTPVRKIHLYDGDLFHTHNAFRSPGAASLEELRAAESKVDYLARGYGRMHRGIVPHAYYIDVDNIHELQGMDFAFLAVDRGDVRKLLVDFLEKYQVPFIDSGMGVDERAGVLGGLVRVTTSTPAQREHVHERDRIPFGDAIGGDYGRNIQIADLNALNATLAVMKWEKLRGFYRDLERERHTVYQIDGNLLTNEDAV